MTSETNQSRMGLRAMLTIFKGIALATDLGIGALSFWGSNHSATAAAQTFVAKDEVWGVGQRIGKQLNEAGILSAAVGRNQRVSPLLPMD